MEGIEPPEAIVPLEAARDDEVWAEWRPDETMVTDGGDVMFIAGQLEVSDCEDSELVVFGGENNELEVSDCEDNALVVSDRENNELEVSDCEDNELMVSDRENNELEVSDCEDNALVVSDREDNEVSDAAATESEADSVVICDESD